jgi:hypothetical protein
MSAVPSASVEAAAEWLRKHFAPEAARGVRAVYQLELSGPGGGPLRVEIDDGVLHVGLRRCDGADVRICVSAADWCGVLAGGENAELLYMAGRIELEGDLALAVKMRTYFRRHA